MKWLGLSTVVVLVAGCGTPTPRNVHEEAALELLALQQGEDGGSGIGWHTRELGPMAEELAWFREQVGRCDHVEFYRRDKRGFEQFVFECERGQLQALIGFDEDGRLHGFRMGARHVEPPARIRELADTWLVSPAGTHQASGCRLDRVAVASLHGALFVVACPGGEKTLRVQVGEHARIELTKGAADGWVGRG